MNLFGGIISHYKKLQGSCCLKVGFLQYQSHYWHFKAQKQQYSWWFENKGRGRVPLLPALHPDSHTVRAPLFLLDTCTHMTHYSPGERWVALHILWLLGEFFFLFLWLPLCRMDVPRLGVEWELQLPAYPSATATSDPSHICDLHCSCDNARSFTDWARPGINIGGHIRSLTYWATMGTPDLFFSFKININR